MIDYGPHRAALESIYEDRATVKRYVEAEAANKATRPQEQVIYADQPCRLSQTQLPANTQSEAQNEIRYSLKLFIAPELEIQQGDVIDVMRCGRTVTATAGEPVLYASHQEVGLLRKGYA